MKQPARQSNRVRMHSQGGFSLIEAMVAILILSVSLLGLAYLQAQSTKFNTSSYTRTQATLLASDFMDKARLHGPAQLDVTAASDCDPLSVDPAVEKRCWLDQVNVTLPTGSAVINIVGNAVQITISWVERQLRVDPNAPPPPNPGTGYAIPKQIVWNVEI